MISHINQGSPEARSERSAYENVYLAERKGICESSANSLYIPALERATLNVLLYSPLSFCLDVPRQFSASGVTRESINLCIYGSLFCFALLLEVDNACFAFTCTKQAQSGIVSLAFQRRHAAKRTDTDME